MKSPQHVLFFALISLGQAGCFSVPTPANEDVDKLRQQIDGRATTDAMQYPA